jgi:TolA-binding protein
MKNPHSARDNAPPPNAGGWRAKLRLQGARTWLRQNRRVAVIGGGGLVFIVVTIATLSNFIAPQDSQTPPPPKLETALALLDSGQYIPAREAAERIQAGRHLEPSEYGAPAQIIGASLLQEADETIDPGDRAARFRVASRYLQRAQERGFIAGRETEGLLLLGRSLHESGQYALAIAALTELEQQSPALRPTAQRLLASCHLRSDPPQLDKAIRMAESVLSAPQLSPSDRDSALLLYGETLLAQRDFARCAELVAQIPSSSPLFPQAMLFKGRSLLAAAQSENGTIAHDADDIKTLYSQAIDALRHAYGRRATDHQVTREASFLIGVALQRSGNRAAAQAQFLRVRKKYYGSPEGIAASLEEAALASELGQPDLALLGYQHALDQVKDSPMLVNPWISDKQLQQRLEAGYAQFLANHQYALAVKLAEMLSPPMSDEQSVEMVAGAQHRWGEHLLHMSAEDKTGASGARLAAARQQFRAAGDAYARLAELRIATRSYTDDVWRAGCSFAAGHDFAHAVDFYRLYLDQESKRERPAVLLKLSEALLSLDRTDEALAACTECMQLFPKDPAAYSARLLASRAYLEKNDLPAAKAMLQANLHHESLTPRSDVWRESLFAMGTLLYDEGLAKLIAHSVSDASASPDQSEAASLEAAHAALHEALRYLDEAVQRYPDDPRATLARLHLAETHRQAAHLPLARLQSETIESRRAALNAQVQQELKAALATYDELTARLNRRADERPLSAVEQSILRNAYFARGGVLYDMGNFESAIQAYSTATNRYQNEPAAVEAYVQIASCYRRLNKPLEARGTIEQAKLVIDRMPTDADFTRTTRFGRDEWNTLLDWLSGT